MKTRHPPRPPPLIAKEHAAPRTERESSLAGSQRCRAKGKRLVETASEMTGSGRRLLDVKLQEVGDQLGWLESRLAEVQRRIALLDGIEARPSG